MVYEVLNDVLPKAIPQDEKNHFERFMSEDRTEAVDLLDRLKKLATKATVIPLSEFTNLFHQQFWKHRYLESMLELMQQFYIALEDACDNSHKMFPEGNYCTSLRCIRCKQQVLSHNGGILDTLLRATSAILWHLHILQTHVDDNDNIANPSSESLPLMYSSTDALKASKQFFEQSQLDSHNQSLGLIQSIFCNN